MPSPERNERLLHFKRVPINLFGEINENMSYQERKWQIMSLIATIPKSSKVDVVVEDFLMPWMNDYDPQTAEHMRRVAYNAMQFGIAYGKAYPDKALSEKELLDVYYGALLHDIGKLAVPTEILHQTDKLTPRQRAITDSHMHFTYMILDQIDSLRRLASVSSLHNELWNGKGPRELKGDQIPLATQIIIIADSFDYITSHRPYFPRERRRVAFDALRRQADKAFSSELICVLDLVRNIFLRDPQLHLIRK